jgi:hypothetical protein
VPEPNRVPPDERDRALKEAIGAAASQCGFLDRERLGFDAGYRAGFAASRLVPEERQESDECVCGHTRHWHGAAEWTCEHGGPEHPDGDCPCSMFRPVSEDNGLREALAERCGNVHGPTHAVCQEQQGHEGPHGNDIGTWHSQREIWPRQGFDV